MADSQKYKPLLHDNPLCGIDTYKDTLNLATGACTRAIKKIVLTGEENWELQSINTHGIANFCTDYGFLFGISSDRTAINSHFYQTTAPIADITEPCFSISPTSETLYLKVLSSVASTSEAMKAWLSAQYANGTPVTLYYILETPTTETITVPTGLSGTEEGYLTQSETPTPTNPIYPTANEVLIWQHSLRKLTTATEAVENPLYSDGTAITAYTLKGNTVQNGTPTPSNPVDVNGVGNATSNVMPYATAQTLSDNGITVTSDGQGTYHVEGLATADANISLTIPEFTIPVSVGSGRQGTMALFNGRIGSSQGDSRLEFYNGSTRIDNWQLIQANRTSITYGDLMDGKNCNKINIFIKSGVSANADIKPMFTNDGTLPTAYEPYGYKLPISNGGVTTNIYLGSTQTTRQVKKLELDGTENGWIKNTDTSSPWFQNDSFATAIPSAQGLCTHFVYTPINSTTTGIGWYITQQNNQFRFRPANASDMSLQDFKDWLAINKPIIYFVLATPRTAAVNEPLMKIGDYADTLSNATAIPTTEGANSITVDTTVQPSEFTATWTGWHDATVKEKSENLWDENMSDISSSMTYKPLYVGNNTVTMSSIIPQTSQGYANLFLKRGISDSGATTGDNGVWDGNPRTFEPINGWVTVAYRNANGVNPQDYNIMLNTGETALPYDPYWK